MTIKEISTTEFTADVLESAILYSSISLALVQSLSYCRPIIDALALEHAGKLKVYKVMWISTPIWHHSMAFGPSHF
jgi:thioredoxin 1